VSRYCCENDSFLYVVISSLISWGEVCDVMFVFIRVRIRHYILKELTSFHETGTKILQVTPAVIVLNSQQFFCVPAWRFNLLAPEFYI